MQQDVQTDATCNTQQFWELLVNNVASVCTQPYLKMTVDRSKRRFMTVIFTVLSFKKPLLIRHSPSIIYCNSYHKFSNICKLENRLVWPAEIMLWKSNTRCSDQLCRCLWTSRFLVLNILADKISYYSFKLFPRFWLAKSICITSYWWPNLEEFCD